MITRKDIDKLYKEIRELRERITNLTTYYPKHELSLWYDYGSTELTAKETMHRFEELYNYLGVYRKTDPELTRLVKRKAEAASG
jgi:hypothetical protein